MKTSVAHRHHRLRCVQNDLGFVETQIQKLDQIINRGLGERVDIVYSMLRERVSLLSSYTFNRGKRHRLARSNERTHLFGDFSLDLFFTADINVPADQLGG